jgi:hypothetical protein
MKPGDWNNKISHIPFVGRESAVCIAARYGMDGLGIESLLGRNFSNSPDRLWVPPVYYKVVTGSFPRVKKAGCGVIHPPPSATEINSSLTSGTYIYHLQRVFSSPLG